jgi:RNA recognition motif-containing protein
LSRVSPDPIPDIKRDYKFRIMNLFVGNLNPETVVANLRTLFSEFGEIVSAKIIFDNATGMSRGFGFVEMADKFHAYDAIDNLDSTFFEGNIISVKEAKQNNTKTGGGSKSSFRPKSPRPGGYNSGSSYSGGNRYNSGSGSNSNSSGNYNNDRY